MLALLRYVIGAERTHWLILNGLWVAMRLSCVRRWMKKAQPTQSARVVAWLSFKNSVGIAAGLDKNGEYIDALACLGVSVIEIGSVTYWPQPGNSRPRLWYDTANQSIINRMGFNNDGAHAVARNLMRVRAAVRDDAIIIGVNIGKNADVPLAQAAVNYIATLSILYDLADYFVINVSSPNTPGLRSLQARDQLGELLGRLTNAARLRAGVSRPKPLFVKIAPELTNTELDDVIMAVRAYGIAGFVATNTEAVASGTDVRPFTATADAGRPSVAGGRSGQPLHARTVAVVRYLHDKAPDLPIIATGGVMSGEDARDFIRAGASLVQVYTGLMYRGMELVSEIVQDLNTADQRR